MEIKALNDIIRAGESARLEGRLLVAEGRRKTEEAYALLPSIAGGGGPGGTSSSQSMRSYLEGLHDLAATVAMLDPDEVCTTLHKCSCVMYGSSVGG